jgi:hypothetical protein
MTIKEIRKRRAIRAMGRKKFVIIEKTKTKHDLVFFVAPLNFFDYWQRIKSLFKFSRFVIPEYFNFRGHKSQVSKYRLAIFN